MWDYLKEYIYLLQEMIKPNSLIKGDYKESSRFYFVKKGAKQCQFLIWYIMYGLDMEKKAKSWKTV